MSSIATYEIDSYQRTIFERAKLDPDEPANMLTVAKNLGLQVETLRPPPFHDDGSAVRLRGVWRIYLRGGISAERKRFALAHEVAEIMLRDELLEGATEDVCNATAAAMLTPRRAFARSLREERGWTQLALEYKATESLVVLRGAEVTGTPTALIAPATTRVRGDEYGWPETESQIRRLAKLPALPGMKRARLKDDPRRVVIEAEQGFDDVA